MAIYNTFVSNSSAANITPTISENTVVSVAYICNTYTSAIGFNLYAVPAGGTAGPTNQIYSNVQIAHNDTYVMDMEKIVLGPGDSLRASCQSIVSNVLVATVSYVGI